MQDPVRNRNPSPATRFKKGQSGNPLGRPRVTREVVDLCRHYSPAVVERFYELVMDKKSPPATVVAAGNAILDRAWGRPAQSMDVHMTRTVQEMTTDELIASILTDRERERTSEPAEGEGEPSGLH